MIEQLRRHLFDLILAVLFCAVLFYATRPFTVEQFATQYRVDQAMTLFFGGVYLLAKTLVDVSDLLLVVVFVLLVGVFWGIRHSIMGRRWPRLIPIIILVISNVVFIGAPVFLFTGHLGEPIQDCEKFIDGQTGFIIKRYPISRNNDTYERQFYLKTHTDGARWEQFITVEVRAPQLAGCENIEFFDDESGVIEIDNFNGDTYRYNYLHYTTLDGGRTWQEQEVDES